MTAVHEQISEARKLRRKPVIHLDSIALSIGASHLSLKEIGKQWLALLNGRPSEFENCVVRVRSVAPGRRAPPGWEKTRQRIFERDGRTCTYCGSTEALECDHVIPVAKGGGHDDDNLTTACKPCNLSKRDLLPDEWQ